MRPRERRRVHGALAFAGFVAGACAAYVWQSSRPFPERIWVTFDRAIPAWQDVWWLVGNGRKVVAHVPVRPPFIAPPHLVRQEVTPGVRTTVPTRRLPEDDEHWSWVRAPKRLGLPLNPTGAAPVVPRAGAIATTYMFSGRNRPVSGGQCYEMVLIDHYEGILK